MSIMDKSMLISTHSAREDGDDIEPDNISSGTEISTHSAREDGDGTVLIGYHPTYISTHSAREDGDFNDMLNGRRLINFNPLRPRGRRPLRGFYKPSLAGFQPTPPARTETAWHCDGVAVNFISTHSAREDGDLLSHSTINLLQIFQPTPPARTETGGLFGADSAAEDFNPLRPRGRRPRCTLLSAQ